MLILNKARAFRAALSPRRIDSPVTPSQASLDPALPNRMTRLIDIVAIEDRPQTGEILRACAAIDAVHRLHRLPSSPLPVLPVTFLGLPEPVAGRILYSRGDDLKCLIQIDSGNRHAALTFVHEIGHFIDILLMGKGMPLSGVDDRFEEWRTTVSRTRAFARLEALAYEEAVMIAYPSERARRFEPDEATRADAEYRLRWKELWARSYAQYTAMKSGEPALIAQLRQELESDVWTLYHHQWMQDDFEPVYGAMDRLLAAWE